MHYFSYSCGPGADPTKSTLGHVMPNICFCILCDMRVTYCILVLPEHKISMYYFSFSSEASAEPTKSAPGLVMLNMYFLHLVRPAGHVVRSCAFGVRNVTTLFEVQNVNTLFFMLVCAPCGSHKKCVGTHYAKLVFLIPAGPAGHVVSSGASGARNVNTL
jgi:hypothetical protein